MSAREVVIRYCVGEKGSRKAVAEVWTTEDSYKANIEEMMCVHKHLTLAHVFGAEGDFIEQYERL